MKMRAMNWDQDMVGEIVIHKIGRSDAVDIEWSEWSSCGSSCGASTQSRWSRCVDSGSMMECIERGGEKKASRACNLAPCDAMEAVMMELKEGIRVDEERIKSVRKKSVKEFTNNVTELNNNKTSFGQLDRILPLSEDSKKGSSSARISNLCHCSIFGVCDEARLTCTCNSGWTGRDCSRPLCHPPCSNGGICSRPDVCACKQGYTGARCQHGRLMSFMKVFIEMSFLLQPFVTQSARMEEFALLRSSANVRQEPVEDSARKVSETSFLLKWVSRDL